MREIVLRRFFEGELSVAELANDLKGSLVRETNDVTKHPIENMDGAFEVLPSHLIKVCDSVLDGSIAPELLESIGFCLLASDAFQWDNGRADGAVVADVAIDWSDPTINHPLTLPNVAKWRRKLSGEQVSWQ